MYDARGGGRGGGGEKANRRARKSSIFVVVKLLMLFTRSTDFETACCVSRTANMEKVREIFEEFHSMLMILSFVSGGVSTYQ